MGQSNVSTQNLSLQASLRLIAHPEFMWIRQQIRAVDNFVASVLSCMGSEYIYVHAEEVAIRTGISDVELVRDVLNAYHLNEGCVRVYFQCCPNSPSDLIWGSNNSAEGVLKIECDLCNEVHVLNPEEQKVRYRFNSTALTERDEVIDKIRLKKTISNYPKSRLKVLMITSDPLGSDVMNEGVFAGEELKAVKEIVSEHHIQICHESEPDPDEMHRLMIKHDPDIVHFSGHGDLDGVELVDRVSRSEIKDVARFDNEDFARLMEYFGDSLICVVMNSCTSREQAKIISQFVPLVVGTATDVYSDAAIRFSTEFYSALCLGASFEKALGSVRYMLGRLELEDVYMVASCVEGDVMSVSPLVVS